MESALGKLAAAGQLYLSACLERNRSAYYDSLQAIREKGDAVPWLDLFLSGVQAELIFDNPVLTTKSVENALGVSRPTALRLLRRMAEQGIVTQREPGARGQQRYVAHGVLKVLAGDSNE